MRAKRYVDRLSGVGGWAGPSPMPKMAQATPAPSARLRRNTNCMPFRKHFAETIPNLRTVAPRLVEAPITALPILG